MLRKMKHEQLFSVTLNHWQDKFLKPILLNLNIYLWKKAFGVKFLILFDYPFLTSLLHLQEWKSNWNEIVNQQESEYIVDVYKTNQFTTCKSLPFKKEGNLPHTAEAIHFDKMHVFVNHKQTFHKTVSLFLLIPCRRVQFSLPVSLSKRPEHQISALDCQVWSLFPFKFQNTDTLIGVHSVRQQHLRDIFAKI